VPSFMCPESRVPRLDWRRPDATAAALAPSFLKFGIPRDCAVRKPPKAPVRFVISRAAVNDDRFLAPVRSASSTSQEVTGILDSVLHGRGSIFAAGN